MSHTPHHVIDINWPVFRMPHTIQNEGDITYEEIGNDIKNEMEREERYDKKMMMMMKGDFPASIPCLCVSSS